MKTIPWWWNKIPEESKRLGKKAIAQNLFSSGELTNTLEAKLAYEFSAYCAVVNSGTSALFSSLIEIGVGPGDEVLIPALTWVATAHAVMMTGAIPILVDVCVETMCMDVSKFESKINKKTKAVIFVNFNGQKLSDSDATLFEEICKSKKIFVIEDSCKAMGSEILRSPNKFSRSQSFSMGMISLISIGYGGFVLSKDKYLIDRIRLIRDHGLIRNKEEIYKLPGSNLKLSDILSSIAIPQVPQIKKIAMRNKYLLKLYIAETKSKSFSFFNCEGENSPTYFQILCRSEKEREFFWSELKKNGVSSQPYHKSLSKVPYIHKWSKNETPNADWLAERLLTLPSGNSLNESTIKKVVNQLNRIDNLID